MVITICRLNTWTHVASRTVRRERSLSHVLMVDLDATHVFVKGKTLTSYYLYM